MEAAYVCLPNLLAGGLPAGALPGLALAADKRAQHTRATQKSTTRARHTKRDAWIYTGEDMKEAMEMRGRRRISIAAVISPVYIHASLFVWRARVLCSFVWRACAALFRQLHMQAPDRAAHLQASPQPRD